MTWCIFNSTKWLCIIFCFLFVMKNLKTYEKILVVLKYEKKSLDINLEAVETFSFHFSANSHSVSVNACNFFITLLYVLILLNINCMVIIVGMVGKWCCLVRFRVCYCLYRTIGRGKEEDNSEYLDHENKEEKKEGQAWYETFYRVIRFKPVI